MLTVFLCKFGQRHYRWALSYALNVANATNYFLLLCYNNDEKGVKYYEKILICYSYRLNACTDAYRLRKAGANHKNA